MTHGCPAVYDTEDGEERCLSLHPTEQSLAMHLFKTPDDAHAEWDDFDATLREVFRANYEVESPEPTVEDGADTVAVDDPQDADAGGTGGPSPTVADGGGPRTPPEPEILDEPEEPDEETVPDHLVPTDEFVDEVEDELPDEMTETEEWEEFAANLRDDPEGFVDTRASDIEAGEVTTTDA